MLDGPYIGEKRVADIIHGPYARPGEHSPTLRPFQRIEGMRLRGKVTVDCSRTLHRVDLKADIERWVNETVRPRLVTDATLEVIWNA